MRLTFESAIERAFDKANLIGENVNLYSVINSYKVLRELPDDVKDKIYDMLAYRLGFAREMKKWGEFHE